MDDATRSRELYIKRLINSRGDWLDPQPLVLTNPSSGRGLSFAIELKSYRNSYDSRTNIMVDWIAFGGSVVGGETYKLWLVKDERSRRLPADVFRPSGIGRSCQGLVDIIAGHGALIPTWQSATVFSVEHHVEDRRMKWSSKGLGGAEHTLSTLLFASVKVWLKTSWGASLVRFSHSLCPWCGLAFDALISMGGDSVITESVVLSMEEDVQAILEDSGLLPFFKKFTGRSEAITKQFVETWKNGRVTIMG
eukprot:Gb_26400 [translate_table: standard]